MAEAVLYFIAACACVFAVLSVTARNVFHGAVWLALTLLSVSGFYFYLDAEFVGVIQVLVYIGGVMTLFIFVINLTAKLEDKTVRQTNQQILPSAVAAVALFYFLLKIIGSNPWAQPALSVSAGPVTLKQLGQSLMTGYALPFEFISVVLLAAMVGAIVIGKVKK